MKEDSARVIWITGLSGAGKTTLAKALLRFLPESSILLDGDEMREALAPVAGGYDCDSRRRLAHCYARLCGLIAAQGVTVVCATISLFHDVQTWNRKNLPRYFEVFLDINRDQLLARDGKRVYNQTPSVGKENSPVMGRELVPEYPQSPDMTIQNHDKCPEEIAECIFCQVIEPRPLACSRNKGTRQ